jgi:hypothetical protein
LKSGYVSVNWDVEEMEAHREEIVAGRLTWLGFINAKVGLGGMEWKK